MQFRRGWWSLVWFVTTVMLCAYQTSAYLEAQWAEVRDCHGRCFLGQIRLGLENYETLHGHPLRRVTTDDQGHTISWREALAPVFGDSESLSVNGAAPVRYRLPFDKSDPRFTSLVAIYEAKRSDDDTAPWAIAAIENSGIEWNAPRDFTIEQFEAWVDASRDKKQPTAWVITSSGSIGSIIDGRLRFSLGDPHQPGRSLILSERQP